jgi:hypothetical protein
MDMLLRFLNRPVHFGPASPRVRRLLLVMLAGWVVLNLADWLTSAVLLVRGGSHEDNPIQAALLARGGLVALAGYKVLVIGGGAVLTWLGFRLWPRFFITLLALCELLVAVAVANNLYWLVRR